MKQSDWRKRKSASWKDKFEYWFDNRIAKGSLGLIRALVVASVIFAILVALLIIIFRFNEEGSPSSVIWNSISTLLNAEMPYFEDGSLGYVILIAVSAIAGVLFTSVLIGIFTSAIEEKIVDLKHGNSLVLEEGHTVVLGYYPGEYTLINQLILAAADKPACVVLAGDMERDEMEQDLKDNVNIPDTFRIVCRKVDLTDPSSIEKCSLETCKTVIVSPTDDFTTVKSVLAVSALMKKLNIDSIRVNAIVSKNEYRLPPSLTEMHNISTLQTNDIIAKMIAHSCTQTGLSDAFREIFNFEGSEFYLIHFDGISGLTFAELMARLDKAVPVGIWRDEKMTLNPPSDYMLEENDKIIVFAEDSEAAVLEKNPAKPSGESFPLEADYTEKATNVMVFGYNETLPLVLRELPEHVNKVSLVGQHLEGKAADRLNRIAKLREFQLNVYPNEPETEEELVEFIEYAEHIILLNQHDRDPEEADMDVIILLLRLRDIRTRYNLDFNITVEMQLEHNQKLVDGGDHTDFLVSSSTSSLILAQLAESPELISAFREILSNKGNELYLKNVGDIRLAGNWNTRDLRNIILKHGYILLGYLDSDLRSHYNPGINEEIQLEDNYSIIVLGQD